MKFSNSKYTKLYELIIYQALNRVNTRPTERHHIIPKSLGGLDDASNIVKLSYREHFLCHLLLTKMTQGENKRKMIYAMWMMKLQGHKSSSTRTNENLKKTSKWYAKIRNSMAGPNSYMFGIPKSEEIKKKISETLTGRAMPITTIEKIKKTTNSTEYKARRYNEKWGKTSSEMQKGVRACTWTLQDPNGEIHETKTLYEFCKSHKLSYETIQGAWRFQRIVKTGMSKGWKVLKKLDWKEVTSK